MMKHAGDGETFKNTVNHYLSQRLATHSIDEVAELGLSKIDRSMIERQFADCMGYGDISEITTQMVETDDGMDWEMFKLIAEKRADDAIDIEIENQLLILRSDHE